MNEQQIKCFKMLYKFIHDEQINSTNLVGLLEMSFPEIDSEVSKVLHENIKPYLVIRRDLGEKTMDLMYLLNEAINQETIDAIDEGG